MLLGEMAENKNQHYVPKCHLRPFSVGDEGAAVNLYNFRLDKCIPNAAIKNQCSGNYFYGEDLKLEKIFQELEGRYATVIKDLQQSPRIIADDVISTLRNFAYLQYSRTENAVRRRRETMEAMHEISHRGVRDIAGIKIDELDVSHRTMMLDTIRTYTETRKYLKDLRGAVIRNDTEVNFVTSDDPAIVTNRVFLQMLKSESFGLASCGVQVFLPLTPRLGFVCYDKDAYAAPQRAGNWLSLNRAGDVAAINELQFLKCEANVYFHRWEDRENITAAFREAVPRRPGSFQRFWVGMQVGENEDGDLYRRATEEEIASTGTKIISFSPIFPTPSRWFSGLRYRNPVRGWDSGTGVGLVRESYATSDARKANFRRVNVRPGVRAGLAGTGPETAFHRRSPADRAQEARERGRSE